MIRERLRGHPVLRKIVLWGSACLALFAVAGFLVVPPVLKSVLTGRLSAQLHREVTIRQIQFNPFVLAVKVSGVSVKERGGAGPFVSFEELYLNLQLASVYRGGPVLADIILKSPRITVVRGEDLRYNFSDILDEMAAKPKAEGKPLRYSLNNIQIVDGSVDFDDRPKRTRHAVRDLRVSIPFISNLPYFLDSYVQPVFMAKVNGTPIDLRGKTKPFSGSRETSFDIEVSRFDIPYYLAYVPVAFRARVASAFLDARAVLAFREYKDRPPVLSFTGKAALRSVRITDEKDRPVLAFPLLDVSIVSSDLFEKKVALGTVLLQSPELNVTRGKAGALNIASLFEVGEKQGGPPDKAREKDKATRKENGKEAPFVAQAAEIRLAGGTVAFEDQGPEKPFRTRLSPVDVLIRHFSNEPGKETAVEASLATEAGETLRHDGAVVVQPLGARGTVEIKGVRLKKYSPYYARGVAFDVEDGLLDLSSGYRYAPGEKGGETKLTGLAAGVRSLRLRKRGEDADFLKVPAAAVRGTDVDLVNRTVAIGEVSGRGGELLVRRESDGRLNVATLVPPEAPAPEGAASAAGAAKTAAAGAPEWSVLLRKAALERYSVRFEDKVPATPVTLSLDRVSVAAENISTRKNSRGTASLRFATGAEGQVALSGAVGVTPLFANLKSDVRGIDVVPFQPYFTDKVKIIVASGAVGAAGNLSVSAAPDNTTAVGFRGEASLTKLATMDKANSEDFLKWDSLHLAGVRTTSAPLSVEIDEIALADFYSRLAVNPDGTLNVQGIVAGEAGAPAGPPPAEKSAAVPPPGRADAAPATREAAPAKTIRIGRVTLQGGRINFSDRYVKPNYFANLTELGGRISGLSSEESRLADVDLKGMLENVAPLEIRGKINPLRDDLYVDLGIDFRDIDLSPMTPYSGRYAGYTIQKGKLTLSLKYLIVKKRLEASNNVFLDQFTFGDAVESPDATKLPVRLAIALLKDRKGEIRLDVPLTGSLDDPKFSVWKVVIQVIKNILVKAATSPFALLGAVFGGGEELSYVEFGHGLARLDNAAQAKLRTLEKALADRPALKLEITGHADPERDREELRRIAFDRKIKAQKRNDLAKQGAAAPPLDDVTVASAEYPKYLALAYKAETFPKPRNIIGMAKDLPAPEMEKLILTHIVITDDDLGKLAGERAQSVREFLLGGKRVETDRIFLVTAKSLRPEKKEKQKDSRVDFVIK